MADDPQIVNTETIADAIDLYSEDRARRKRTIQLGIGAFFCAVLGAGTVLAVVFLTPNALNRPAAPVQVAVNPPVKQEENLVSAYQPDKPTSTEPTEPTKNEPEKKDEAKPETKPQDSPNPSAPAPSHVPPFDPFNGEPVPEGWAKGRLNGEIDVQPERGAQIDPDRVPPPIKEKTPEPARLVIAKSGGGDPESDAQAIVRALQSAGASVRSSSHYSPSGSVVGVQIVATLPATSLDSAKSRLQSAGARVGEDWKGELGERNTRAENAIATRLSALRNKKLELLQKYLDDAPQVTQVEDEIQKLNQCLGAARLGGKSAKNAVMVIGIGTLTDEAK
ncbi:MAG: hypothetical protein BGO01_18965 [Armatimonadetes bacterium 55-13]|nr:hypothetical protein [Armatimonadota bacterium]ODU53858.1 MAG: hypothetical protein ABT09_00920 [bacterium SCN 57-13]OJU64206.1 MAG: hypothetical protein BGO01_18965 [Armatimonadetes bacterium 55-13]